MSEGRYKCDLLGAKAKRAILELSSSAADSECTDHVLEKLFSIALFSISSLEQTRTNHPETVRTFASKQTQWPYMLDAPGRDMRCTKKHLLHRSNFTDYFLNTSRMASRYFMPCFWSGSR
jgi:hypothetical protein